MKVRTGRVLEVASQLARVMASNRANAHENAAALVFLMSQARNILSDRNWQSLNNDGNLVSLLINDDLEDSKTLPNRWRQLMLSTEEIADFLEKYSRKS